MPFSSERLDECIGALPRTFAGPGGAVAVLRDGEVLVRHTWGWANAERRIPFTPQSLFRICSITKQFTCALALDLFPEISVLDGDVRAQLPALQQSAPGALHLCHNQSGLRDYWALGMLHGAAPEAAVGEADSARLMREARTLHFAPGARYSYCNQNFRILSDILQERAGRSFAELLSARVFAPAGMAQAQLGADTREMPDGTQGYEGTPANGFRPAENRIFWTGDAGLLFSLDDLIAWERHVDKTRDDPDGLYRRISAPATIGNGVAAAYGFGLGRRTENGRVIHAHGGALRGWRSHRLHVPSERLSIVVLFNHMADPAAAAVAILKAVLNESEKASAPPAPGRPEWIGAYLDPETSVVTRIEDASDARIRVRQGSSAEILSGTGTTRLSFDDGRLWLERTAENERTALQRCDGPPVVDAAGRYRCEELQSELVLADAGGVLYGSFSGFLGQSAMTALEPVGTDVWLLPCPRAIDQPPPGEWTLVAQRASAKRVVAFVVGCPLARRLSYTRDDR